MQPGASGLGDGAVHEVGADGDDGARSKDQNQKRRHDRPASDTGESNEEPDNEPRCRECEIHASETLRAPSEP